MPDVTVVGGGPAGSLTARLLAASDRDVTLLEEHNEVGLPLHCAGFVSDEVIQRMGVRPDVYSSICRADLKLPDGRTLKVGRRSPLGFVIDRRDMDSKLLDLAAKHGADIRMGERCNEVSVTGEKVVARTDGGEIRSDLLVGADGQNSTIAASWGNNFSKEYLRGYQIDIKHTMEDQEKMVLRVGNTIAPGLFAWEFPMEDITRIGVCVTLESGSPADYVKKILSDAGLSDCPVVQSFGGKVPIGGRRTTVNDRVLLIGDAAGQVKPVSAGGLYPITVAAPILANVIDQTYGSEMFTTSQLALYERGWKREMGRSLRKGMRLRRMYNRLSDRQLCHVAALFDTPEVKAVLNTIDIDDPSAVVGPILKIKGMKAKLARIYLRSFF